MVEEFYSKGFILVDFNFTLVTFIPKKNQSVGFEDYRPFSLYNTCFKIITKVATNRFKKVLHKSIFLQKIGFTPNYSIVYGIIMTHETVHIIKKGNQQRMVPKLHIRKAYDKGHRDFLIKVLNKFGFSKNWVGWIKNMIGPYRLSILVNRSPKGFFHTTRGIS